MKYLSRLLAIDALSCTKVFILLCLTASTPLMASAERCELLATLSFENAATQVGEDLGLPTELISYLILQVDRRNEGFFDLAQAFFQIGRAHLFFAKEPMIFANLSQNIKKTTGTINEGKVTEIVDRSLEDLEHNSRLRKSATAKAILEKTVRSLTVQGKYHKPESIKAVVDDNVLLEVAKLEELILEAYSKPTEPSVKAADVQYGEDSNSNLIVIENYQEDLAKIEDKQVLKKIEEIRAAVAESGENGHSSPRKPLQGYPGLYEFKIGIQPGYRIYYLKIPRSKKLLFAGVAKKPAEHGEYNDLKRAYRFGLTYLATNPTKQSH